MATYLQYPVKFYHILQYNSKTIQSIFPQTAPAATRLRVKIDDMNVSSSECPFESLYHTIPSAHA